jgi:hypothetical protein
VKTRRVFLAGLVVTGAVGPVWLSTVGGGEPPQLPQAPRATQDKNTSPAADNPNMPSREKQLLEENEKDIKKKVEKLYELATELKAEVEKTDSSKVLSLAMLKKTEEIEKLAKDIRNRSKG